MDYCGIVLGILTLSKFGGLLLVVVVVVIVIEDILELGKLFIDFGQLWRGFLDEGVVKRLCHGVQLFDKSFVQGIDLGLWLLRLLGHQAYVNIDFDGWARLLVAAIALQQLLKI